MKVLIALLLAVTPTTALADDAPKPAKIPPDLLAFARECAINLHDTNVVIDNPKRRVGKDVDVIEFKEKRSRPSGPPTLDVRKVDGVCHWLPGE